MPPSTEIPVARTRKEQLLRRPTKCLVLFCLALLVATTVKAGEPIDIEADHAEFDEPGGTSLFQGNVHLRQGTLSITADRITLYRTGNRLQRAVAEGKPARFSQRLQGNRQIRAEAREIEYTPASEELRMTGQAHLWHDKNRFSGERITYNIRNNQVQAESGGGKKRRVHAIIYPDETRDP